jgi:hypothetical protein
LRQQTSDSLDLLLDYAFRISSKLISKPLETLGCGRFKQIGSRLVNCEQRAQHTQDNRNEWDCLADRSPTVDPYPLQRKRGCCTPRLATQTDQTTDMRLATEAYERRVTHGRYSTLSHLCTKSAYQRICVQSSSWSAFCAFDIDTLSVSAAVREVFWSHVSRRTDRECNANSSRDLQQTKTL